MNSVLFSRLMNIRCISNPRCTLGEGPFWDNNAHVLYWVDILEKKIYCFNPADETTGSWTTPSYVGFVIINRGRVTAGLKSGLYNLTLNSNGTVAANEIIRLDESQERIRVNDGTLDTKGRVWACTMDMDEKLPLGKFFCLGNNGETNIIDDGYVIGNGPAVSSDCNTLYTVETIGGKTKKKGIYEFVWTENRFQFNRFLIDWNWNTSPDGITTDHAGRLWIGEFGGNVLRCFLPNGKLHSEIPLPAFNITKAAVGGADNNKLYITSARVGVNESTLEKYPHTGGILEIEDLNL